MARAYYKYTLTLFLVIFQDNYDIILMDAEKRKRFTELLSPYQSGLVAYIRHLLWQKQDLEDALQSVLLQTCRKFDKFRVDTNFKAWIFQIATFVVFNRNRRYKKEMQVKSMLQPDEIADPADLWEDLDYRKLLKGSPTIMDKMSQEIKDSISVLNPNERGVFLLRSLGGLDYKEIARILAMPVGSVMGHLARARYKLREKLFAYAKQARYL